MLLDVGERRGPSRALRSVTIEVTEKVHEGLGRMAAERGMRASQYAGLLFEAGYAARATGTDDAELDATVAAVLILHGNGLEPAAMAQALKVPEARVERILAAWERLRSGKALAEAVAAPKVADAAESLEIAPDATLATRALEAARPLVDGDEARARYLALAAIMEVDPERGWRATARELGFGHPRSAQGNLRNARKSRWWRDELVDEVVGALVGEGAA